MEGFTRRRGEIVYEGRTISVGRYDYDTPDGGQMVREIVHHMGSVSVIPWTGHEVVLLRQFRAPVGHWILEIPAGKRDVDGEDPLDTARRELIEEVGLTPGRLTLLHDFFNTPGFCDERSLLYLAEDLAGAVASPQGAEEQAAERVQMSLDEAQAAMDDGRIVDAKTIIGLYALVRRLQA